ncbi:squalene synthase HpnC [bacterium]|nr:squalene synthase HpnC [bacterium]
MQQPYDFSLHLALYGPKGTGYSKDLTADSANAYCVEIAESHYENFPVLSWAVPPPLRQHFANVYAFCRWSDDLGDEVGNGDESAELLDWWRQETESLFLGRTRHPVMMALAGTINEFSIPPTPFLDLISAFRQDQYIKRYATFDELRDYCRRSADPVGRIVLYLLRCYTQERVALSDAICTGLQLANFLQDVGVDYREKGRIYLPQKEWERYGVDESMFALKSTSPELVELMKEEVSRAEGWLNAGLPLARQMPGRFRLMIALFGEGGLAILRRIRRAEYNVLAERPRLGKWDRIRALGRAVIRSAGLNRSPSNSPTIDDPSSKSAAGSVV